MSIFGEPGARRPRRRTLAALLAAFVVPAAVAAVTARTDPAARAAVQPKAAAPAAATRGYQLRCWQYGRLIFEEFTRDSPPESAQDVLRLHDGGGGPLLLLETSNATCLLKAAPTPATSKSVPR